MKRLLGVGLVILSVACGSSDNKSTNNNGTGNGNNTTTNGNSTTAAKITISGTVVPLPFLTALQAGDIAGIALVVADPAEVIADPTKTPTPLATAALDPTKCTDTGCTFSIPDVDVSSLSIGASIGVLPSNTNTTVHPLYTGVSQPQITAGKAAGTLSGLFVFAAREDGFAKLATSGGFDPNTFKANGSLIGYVLDSSLLPVAGATLDKKNWAATLAYPSIDSNMQVAAGSGTSTSATGYVLGQATSAAVALGTGMTLTDPNNLTYAVPSPLGSTPGYSLVVVFVPNP